MSVLPDLMMIYERLGYSITAGLDSRHTLYPGSEFTWIFKDRNMLTENWGIALKELHFLETALLPPRRASQRPAWEPRGVYIIGHSYGWSSFALAMLCPKAKLVAIDIAEDAFTAEWVEKSQQIAAQEDLPIEVLKAASPQATPDILGNGGPLDGVPLDLAFVDGLHSPEQVRLDLDALVPHLHPGTVILCHDVVLFGLFDSIDAFAKEHGLDHRVLWSTPSGMSVLTGCRPPLSATQAIHAFGGSGRADSVVQWLRARSELENQAAQTR